MQKPQNEMVSLSSYNPDLALEWHPTKNGSLKPTMVSRGSKRKVWWIGECGHEWEAEIYSRASGRGCPYCSGKRVLEGFNDLASQVPNLVTEYALYHGKLYIDCERLAFTRIELDLDMSDKEKATRTMLVKKPLGVRFKPRELSTVVDYRYEDGVTRISYLRNVFRFNCDWKRRLFSTSFTATCEMAVTDSQSDNVQPIASRNSFDSRDAYYDKVEYFLDPAYWSNYNIIEPSESLDKAIKRLVSKYRRN